MRNWSFRKKFVVGLFGLFVLLIAFQVYSSRKDKAEFEGEQNFSKNEILHLEVSGVILNGKKFLTSLKKYSKNKAVKAIVIDINSPGGAVGPSQELYYEILRVKKETKKPVICSSTGLMASGGYYTALACDKIVVAPGALIGSIGVIMEFANLEDLYGWAKVKRYAITSGKFKDSGAEYRPMRDDERALFQTMIDEVYAQFKGTVMAARKMTDAEVSAVADGRVLTGSSAVKAKLVDVEGTFEDAVRLAAREAGLGDDYRLLKPRKQRPGLLELLELADGADDDELNSLGDVKDLLAQAKKSAPAEIAKTILKAKFLNQPMYLMPGFWE